MNVCAIREYGTNLVDLDNHFAQKYHEGNMCYPRLVVHGDIVCIINLLCVISVWPMKCGSHQLVT